MNRNSKYWMHALGVSLCASLVGLLACAGGDDGTQSVRGESDQGVAFASDAVQNGAQHAEYSSPSLSGQGCVESCSGVCSEICSALCFLCPAAASCVGRVGAGASCELGVCECLAEHCPDLLGEENAVRECGNVVRDQVGTRDRDDE